MHRYVSPSAMDCGDPRLARAQTLCEPPAALRR